MANDYTLSSSWIDIPKNKLEQAKTVIDQAFKDCLILEAKNQGVDLEKEPDFCNVNLEATVEGDNEPDCAQCGVWIRDNGESFDPEQAELIARRIIEELEIDEPFCCSWATTCSKQRIDSFGGGAFALSRGRMTVWVDAMSYVQDAINCADRLPVDSTSNAE